MARHSKTRICRRRCRLSARLQHHADGDRQFVKILCRVPEDGVAAVAQVCAEALEAGIANGDVVLAILARKRQPPTPPSITTPEALKLRTEPTAEGARYYNLRRRREDAKWSDIRSSTRRPT